MRLNSSPERVGNSCIWNSRKAVEFTIGVLYLLLYSSDSDHQRLFKLSDEDDALIESAMRV